MASTKKSSKRTSSVKQLSLVYFCNATRNPQAVKILQILLSSILYIVFLRVTQDEIYHLHDYNYVIFYIKPYFKILVTVCAIVTNS